MKQTSGFRQHPGEEEGLSKSVPRESESHLLPVIRASFFAHLIERWFVGAKYENHFSILWIQNLQRWMFEYWQLISLTSRTDKENEMVKCKKKVPKNESVACFISLTCNVDFIFEKGFTVTLKDTTSPLILLTESLWPLTNAVYPRTTCRHGLCSTSPTRWLSWSSLLRLQGIISVTSTDDHWD